jgi:hypothetical protein
LKQIKVKNLDTGEEMDLIEAEDKLPPSINPLSLHIMRLTSEYVRSTFYNRFVDYNIHKTCDTALNWRALSETLLIVSRVKKPPCFSMIFRTTGEKK